MEVMKSTASASKAPIVAAIVLLVIALCLDIAATSTTAWRSDTINDENVEIGLFKHCVNGRCAAHTHDFYNYADIKHYWKASAALMLTSVGVTVAALVVNMLRLTKHTVSQKHEVTALAVSLVYVNMIMIATACDLNKTSVFEWLPLSLGYSFYLALATLALHLGAAVALSVQLYLAHCSSNDGRVGA